MEKYNGWSNYYTWRVALEFFDGLDPRDIWESWDEMKPGDQAQGLREMIEHHMDELCNDQMLRGWLGCFLDDVNFFEIANHF